MVRSTNIGDYSEEDCEDDIVDDFNVEVDDVVVI